MTRYRSTSTWTDRYGNVYSTQWGGSKCRCLMCGQKNADGNKNRQSYFRAGIGRDEDGWYYGAYSKKHSRKMRRTREKRAWRKELE